MAKNAKDHEAPSELLKELEEKKDEPVVEKIDEIEPEPEDVPFVDLRVEEAIKPLKDWVMTEYTGSKVESRETYMVSTQADLPNGRKVLLFRWGYSKVPAHNYRCPLPREAAEKYNRGPHPLKIVDAGK